MSEEMSTISESGHLPTHYREASANFFQHTDDFVFQEGDYKAGLPASSGACQQYEAKLSSLVRKNGILEGQLAAALAGREAAEKNLSSSLKSKQEMEKKMADAVKEMELLKEKLASVELAQEEANSLSNIVHSDNVRLEHDVAFLKAVMDDTQKVESGFIGLSIPSMSEPSFQPTLIKFMSMISNAGTAFNKGSPCWRKGKSFSVAGMITIIRLDDKGNHRLHIILHYSYFSSYSGVGMGMLGQGKNRMGKNLVKINRPLGYSCSICDLPLKLYNYRNI